MAGEKVLLVENSSAIQELGKNILEEHGYDVTVASNGLAALTYNDLKEVDEVICLYVPTTFYAVGAFYKNFPQVSDEEVMGTFRN